MRMPVDTIRNISHTSPYTLTLAGIYNKVIYIAIAPNWMEKISVLKHRQRPREIVHSAHGNDRRGGSEGMHNTTAQEEMGPTVAREIETLGSILG